MSHKKKKTDKTEEVDDKTLDKITDEARLQLKAYLQSDNAKRLDNLKAWLVILVGRKWHLIEEITA